MDTGQNPSAQERSPRQSWMQSAAGVRCSLSEKQGTAGADLAQGIGKRGTFHWVKGWDAE